MCGICGYIGKKRISEEQLSNMNDQMVHRGPDDSGVSVHELSNDLFLGLAQRRLSIQDLSPMGHQPMYSKDGKLAVVFNGEIYNFKELREELSDYAFQSNCDTEVIIAAYLKWGLGCIDKLNGMFAIALFDFHTETLYMFRDRVGKKPLYYYWDGTELVFASELKCIMEYPYFEGVIRKEVLVRYLYQQYIVAPDTIFQNTYKLAPGEMLTYHEGEYTLGRYWDTAEEYQVKRAQWSNLSYEETLDELNRILIDATKKRMVADVPYGAFLSGGYDSSLVTAIAQSISDEPMKTFTIGFHDKEHNEAVYAAKVAEYLGTRHTEHYIDEGDMFRLIEKLPQYFDEPFADSSQIPMMLVSETAKKDVTVVLSGDGGDELFCGYNVYSIIARARKLDGIGGALHGVLSLPLLNRFPLPYSIRTIANNRCKETKTQFGGENYIALAERMLGTEDTNQSSTTEFLPGKYPREDCYHEKNWQERRMLLDIDTYLPDDVLCKVDRATMMYSMEARCPILDRDVLGLAYGMPHEYKFSNGVKKRILKDLTYRYVPRELLERPKVGFSVPLGKWLRGPLKEQLLSFSSIDYLTKQNIFNPGETNRIVLSYLEKGDQGVGFKYSKVIWPFFVFQQWYEYYKDKIR